NSSGKSTTDDAAVASTSGLVQPRAPPSVSIKTTLVNQAVDKTAPATSKRSFGAAGAPGRSVNAAHTNPTTPTGTLNKKTQRHPSAVTTAPPTIGPETFAAEITVTLSPRARPTIRRGNTSTSCAVVLVMIAAAPMACVARKAISTVGFGAKPQPRLDAVKMPKPAMYSWRRPRMSASRPNTRISTVLTSMYESRIQLASLGEAWK